MKAIIPAAGYATRMYPLTENTPKGLLNVAGKPMIERVIAKIAAIKEINEIFVVTNAKFFKSFSGWQKKFKSKIPIKILNDNTKSNEDRLGSIGDIYFVIEKQKISDDIIIINSDNLFTFGLVEMFGFFKKKKGPVIGTFDVRTVEQAKKMGIPEVDGNGKVVGFVEKPPQPKTTLASIGIYLYPKNIVLMFKKYLDEGNSPDKTGEFVEWLHKRRDVFTFAFDKPEDKWFDIGSIEMYNKVKDGF